jgi:hypothetical protein
VEGNGSHQTPIPPATKIPLSTLSAAENNTALVAASEEYKAALFIRIANEAKYGAMKKKLDNIHLFDQGAYPKTLEKAKAYLKNFQAKASNVRVHTLGHIQEQGIAFLQQGNRQLGPCHNCDKTGHLVTNRPDLNDEERKAVLQVLKSGRGGNQSQAHVNVGKGKAEANKELQECINGVANVHVNLNDASIESVDNDNGYFEGVALLIPTAPSKSKRLDCGQNKLFLDSCATQHTMFGPEYLTRLHSTKVF